MTRIVFSAVFVVCFSMLSLAQGYDIQIKINGLRDTNVILAHYFATSMYPDDTARLDSKGIGRFTGTKPLPGGMYLVYLPNRTIFEILLSTDQLFSMENDTSDFVNKFKVQGCDENQLFYDYQRFMMAENQKNSKLGDEYKNADSIRKNQIKTEVKQISQNIKQKQNEIITQHPDLFLSKFIRATLEIEIPQNPNPSDSLFAWRYYRKHYFDNFDISDPRLLRTPIFEKKVRKYIEEVVPQIPDTLVPEVDMLIRTAYKSDSEELRRFMLATLYNMYNKSQVMCMDKVLLHIIKNYYLKGYAPWSSQKQSDEMKELSLWLEPSLCNNIGMDFDIYEVKKDEFTRAETDTAFFSQLTGKVRTMYSVKPPKYKILVFWEATCSHCQEEMPLFYKDYPYLKSKGAEVVSISMLDKNKKKWVEFINKEQQYDWINVWSPYDNQYKWKYNIKSTPVTYILDTDNKILAKRISPSKIKDFVENVLIPMEK